MSIIVTRTKLRIPRRRADLLSRARLNSLLLDFLDYRFTLISAPAGYGKTCLMIDLAHHASHPVCWYSIDPLDKDPKRFLAHFIHSIKMEFPNFGKLSLDLLDNMPDPLANPEQFVSTLVYDLYINVTENFVVFLDDYHLLDDQPQINKFISLFGNLMDENTHLVLASRKIFNFPDLPLLIGRKQILGIDQTDLAFSTDELQVYFQEKLNIPLSEDDSAEMINNSSGWITGLLLRSKNKPTLLPNQNKAARVAGADLDSYFFDQVFLRQPPTIRKLMLKTSLFEEFNSAFCQEFFGDLEEITWIDFQLALTDHNLFVEQIDDNGIWLRYHNLFRNFLIKELDRQIPSGKERILERLLKMHITSENWEQAFDAAQRLGSAHKMAEVISISFGPLFHAGRIKLLSNWLAVLPGSGYMAHPILYSLKGFTSNELGNASRGINELNHALNNKQIKSNAILKAKSLIWRATSHRFLGNYMKGIKDSFLALSTISRNNNQCSIEAEAYREIGLGYGRLGNNTKSLFFLEKSINHYRTSGKENNFAQVKVDIGYICINMGKFRKAEKHFKETIPHWINQGNNVQLSNLMNNLGYLSILMGDFDNARSWLSKGEEHALLASSNRMQSFILASRADLARSIELFEISIEYYNKAQSLSKVSQDSFLSVYIPLAKAVSLRRLNRLNLAEEILITLQESIHEGTSSYELGLWHLEWGFIQLARNSLAPAAVAFKASLNIFSVINRPYEQAKSLLGLVLTTKFQKYKRLLNKYLKALINILNEVETIKPLLPEFNQHWSTLSDLSSEYLEKSPLHTCLNELNQHRQSLPGLQSSIFPPKESALPVSKIDIRGLGEISVLRDGKRITASEWIHQKTVREILYYLLSNPNGVTKEDVGLAFWPDSSPSQLNCQFKNSIYRLRRAIGSEYINFQQERRTYSFNWSGNYTYDVEEFKNSWQFAISQFEDVDRIKYLRHVATLYKHPFGPQLDGIWAETIRRNLYLIYEEIMLEIATYDLMLQNYSSTKEACSAILEIEPCQEKAYQLGLKAFYSLSDLTGIQRLYQRCQQSFNDLLGIPPSKAITRLYQNLIQNL